MRLCRLIYSFHKWPKLHRLQFLTRGGVAIYSHYPLTAFNTACLRPTTDNPSSICFNASLCNISLNDVKLPLDNPWSSPLSPRRIRAIPPINALLFSIGNTFVNIL